uniref:Alpha pheromone n=1 Tax=Ajellomyces capsulatus TaxID=5037 RepID=C7E665_AJECA|nr:alpha pheromone precursor [Histoplasma capsulatum]
MKFLVVFLTLMTASVWAVAIPAPEPEPAVENPNQGECMSILSQHNISFKLVVAKRWCTRPGQGC